MRKSLLTGAIALSLLSPNVYALSVGNMKVDSHLGEPLDISIDINSIGEDEFSTLDISLASRDLFREAGIEYPRNAKEINLELGPYNNGRATLLVNTAGAVSDPFLHLLFKISWSGGNILREYTALIDPADYQLEPIVQAAAPATSIGLTKAKVEPTLNKTSTEELFRPVKSGDTLSAIAALYRPSDVSIQQAWIAFYRLNQDAFPDSNLNNIEKGARLRIPNDAQMRAISQAEATREVKKLSRPLSAAEPKESAVVAEPPVQKPKPATLVVGGNTEPDEAAEVSTEAPQFNESVTQDIAALSDLEGYDQLASIVTELGSFTQTIKQEIKESRDRDSLLKEELIATRGENRVLTGRMARLEAQLDKMSQLLELQSNALEAINSNLGGSQETPAPGLTLNQLESAEPVVPAAVPEVVEVAPVTPATQGDDTAKTYYEQLLDAAISDAPEEDVNYIEEVLEQSSTSIGQKDDNPVTPEMEAKAAAKKPASPTISADQETASMLANVRASLDDVADSGSMAAPDTLKTEVNIASQDSAYIDALNAEDRSQIQKSEARIAELQKQLKTKLDAAEQIAVDTSTTPTSANVSQPETSETGIEKTEIAANDEAATDLAVSITDQAKGGLSTLTSITSRVSQDTWRLIGGIGAAVIGFMVLLGLRRRKDGSKIKEKEETLNSAFSESTTPDVADIATKSMQHEPEEDEDLEEELHGSSLFDLSDESFMASEAIQDDSSLFSMDDNDDFDSLTDMDSTQIGSPSAITQVVDVDPIAEADVYLAYDRKEQAIEVLEQALSSDPNQSAVVIKLLGLYQASENIEGFTRLFESSAEHVENDSDWNKIKLMAQEFVPGHQMLVDDFDSSIPVLLDEVTDEAEEAEETDSVEPDVEVETPLKSKLSMASETEDLGDLQDDDFADLEPDLESAAKEDADEEAALLDAFSDNESLDLSADSDSALQLEEELDEAVAEVNQHEPDTALALAKAYIELGEEDIARDFLLDVINAGSADLKSEAEEMLASLG